MLSHAARIFESSKPTMDLGFNDPAVLDQLSRKELQGLAKRHKIKANAKVEAGAAHPNPVVLLPCLVANTIAISGFLAQIRLPSLTCPGFQSPRRSC